MSEKRAKQIRRIESNQVHMKLTNEKLQKEINYLKFQIAALKNNHPLAPEPIKESFFRKFFKKK